MKEIQQAADYLIDRGIETPEVGIILGTGLGGLVKAIDIDREIDYSDIPHFPLSTVESHSGKLILGTLSGKKVLAMVGRFHYYEGYSFEQIALPVRVMKLLGVKNLIISNAAGGLNPSFGKSDLMLIDDHINLLPGNPLIGKNLDELGPRFPDMSEPYDKNLMSYFKQEAREQSISVQKGVYVSVPGPNLETRAEYKFLRIIGADAVGMSTVPEVIAARHADIPVLAISVITDLCDPEHLEPVDIKDILEAAAVGEFQVDKNYSRGVEQDLSRWLCFSFRCSRFILTSNQTGFDNILNREEYQTQKCVQSYLDENDVTNLTFEVIFHEVIPYSKTIIIAIEARIVATLEPPVLRP